MSFPRLFIPESDSMSEGTNNDDCHEAIAGELVTQIEETAEEIKEELAEVRATFVGPIPPPDILQGYDNILPGLADRIVSMAEAEGNHRRDPIDGTRNGLPLTPK